MFRQFITTRNYRWRNKAELTSVKRWTSECLDTFGIYSQVNLNQWWIQQFGIWGIERERGGGAERISRKISLDEIQ